MSNRSDRGSGRISDRATRALLRCGLVAGPVFVGVSTAEGLLRPSYRAMRHPISSLAMGPRGGVQSVNFAVTGALCSALATGLARLHDERSPRSGPAAIALGAAGLVVCGAFTADPVNGYPPGTPPTPETMTGPGYVHVIASSAVMVGVPVATALYGAAALRSGQRRWGGLSLAATVITAGAFGSACAGFAQAGPLPAVAGGLQRVAVTAGFCWLTALARRALRRTSAV